MYEIPNSPVKRFETKVIYCSVTGLLIENFSDIFSESSVPSLAETYLSVGLPGEILIRKNRKLIRRKRVSNEEKNLSEMVFTICELKNLFIKRPLPAMDQNPVRSNINIFYPIVISYQIRSPVKESYWFIVVD